MLYEVRPSPGELRKMQLDTHPQCALFEQEIVPGPREGESMVVVRYHGSQAEGLRENQQLEDAPLKVPLEPDVSSLEQIDVVLHKSPASAYRMGDPYDSWFSQRFGFPVMLVYIGGGRRAVPIKSLLPKTTTTQEQQQGWISTLASYIGGPKPNQKDSEPWLTFTDVAPLLITSEASLRDVTERLLDGQSPGMYKFRPNIVVDGEGEDPWAEDFWAELAIDSESSSATNQTDPEQHDGKKNTLLLTGNCARCVSLNVDYQTGKPASGELGTLLKKLMKERRVDPGEKWSPIFGRYAFVDGSNNDADGFTVSVGDGVRVTRRNTERTVLNWDG
jgi:uncharacterized protein YcbX